ncbi:hypothetical protein SMMN14_02036 [Sphaerulina musiva]
MADLDHCRSERPKCTATEALLDLGEAKDTPLVRRHSLQNGSSSPSTLDKTAPPHCNNSRCHDGSNAPQLGVACIPECSAGQAEALHEPGSPAYTVASFLPINKSPSGTQTAASTSPEPGTRISPLTSETFRQHHGRHISDISIDMYEVGEHELECLDEDERRVYHIGLNTGGSYSGRFTERPLKAELADMVSQTLADLAEKTSVALRWQAGAETEDGIRLLLSAGSKLVLWQMSPSAASDSRIECLLLGCLARTKYIAPGAFYLTSQPSATQPSQEEAEEGHYSLEQPRHPGERRHASQFTETISPSDIKRHDDDDHSSANSASEKADDTIIEGSFHDPFGVSQVDDASDAVQATRDLERHNDDDHSSADSPSEKAHDTVIEESFHDPFGVSQVDGASDAIQATAYASKPSAGNLDREILEASRNSNTNLYASKWAVFEGENDTEEESPTPAAASSQPAAQPSTPEPTTDPDKGSTQPVSDPPSPAASTDSHGQWQHPPRRIQYIAAFICPSATLTPEVRAAVWLWKAASKTQLDWNRHLEKARGNYDFDYVYEKQSSLSSSPSSASQSHPKQPQQTVHEFDIESDEYGMEEIQQYEELAGFRKIDCYGNVLSEMVRRAHKKLQQE